MTYSTLADFKEFLGITGSTEDDWLTALLTAADAAITAATGRIFTASTQTRYYPQAAVAGATLHLDADLLTVTTLTNGDGNTIDAADFVLLPRNQQPYWALRLTGDAAWSFAGRESEISVAGDWGYTTTAPADVAQVSREYAALLYRAYDRQTSVDLARAVATFPPGFAGRLSHYRKRSL
jgi:uncharacterized phiE125 gp8 family phage protein